MLTQGIARTVRYLRKIAQRDSAAPDRRPTANHLVKHAVASAA